MRYKQSIFIGLIFIPLIIILAGLIGAILRLINLQSIIIAIVLIYLFSNNKTLRITKKLMQKAAIYIKGSRLALNTPSNKSQAAKQSLQSIEQMALLIQNKIDAEGLKYEKERVEDELLRGDLVVVVLGTGSTGKTSLIRALLKRIVGETGPSIGSTKRSNRYRLQLKSLARGIILIDTPGILEGGEDGRMREKEALMFASRADLIIFVIDSDLRAFEMEIIENLSKVGKKFFIAINKSDLRGITEEERLVPLIRTRCKGLIMREDIFSTTASPQSIPVVGGYPIQPKPEITKLIQRMAFVLHEEGEELIADNILLQCRNLGESGRKLLKKQRFLETRKCVDRYVWISSGVIFLTPLPGVDMLGAAVINGRMVMEIAKIYGVELSKASSKDLAISVGQTLAGLGLVKGGLSIITNSLTLHLPTYLIGKSVQSVTAGWLTKIAGESFITYFQQDQNWGDGGIQEVVQHHYKLNSREITLRTFLRSAVERVIQKPNEFKKKELAPRQELLEEEEA